MNRNENSKSTNLRTLGTKYWKKNEKDYGMLTAYHHIIFQKTKTLAESMVNGTSGNNQKSSLIEKEMKALQKIKFKQVRIH